MNIYGLSNCDTCRKARKALPGADFADVRADGIPDAVLAKALDQFGAALVNTRSTTWRGLDSAQRAGDSLTLLKAHPALMKRPLIVDGTAMYLGWGPDVRARLLGTGAGDD
jgi:arsenate reductase